MSEQPNNRKWYNSREIPAEGGREMNFGELILNEPLVKCFASTTPETDSETNYCDAIPDMPWVDVDVARRLERERDEARNELEDYKASTVHSCNEECKRPMCVLRRERDEAREKYHQICSQTLIEINKAHKERDEAQKHLRDIGEYGTEEINASVELRQKLAAALLERDEAKKKNENYFHWVNELVNERDELKKIVEQRILAGAEIHDKANSLLKQSNRTEAECEVLRKQLTAATSALRQIHLEVGDWIKSTIIVEE